MNTAADTGSTSTAGRIIDLCIIFDGYSADSIPTTTTNTCGLSTTFGMLNDSITGNGYVAFTSITAAYTRASVAANCFFDNCVASNSNSGIAICTTTADTSTANRIRPLPRVSTANGSNSSAGNRNIGIAAGTATADTSTIESACSSNGTAGDFELTGIFDISAADSSTSVITTGGSQRTILIRVSDGQCAAGFVALRIGLLIMFQTCVPAAARQSIITVQLNVRIAAAGNAYSGFACFAGIDIDVIQRDIHRLAFICIDRYCIRRRGRSVAVCNNRVRIILSCFTILCDIVAAFTSRNRDVTIFNVPCTRKGGERHPDHKGGGEGEGGGALCGGAAGCFDRRNRAVPQNTHGEFAIRDHKRCLLTKFQIR